MPFNNKVGTISTTNNTLSGNTVSLETAGISIKPEFKVADSIEVPNSGIIALCACKNQTITRQEAMSGAVVQEDGSIRDLMPINPKIDIHFIHSSRTLNLYDLRKLHKQIYAFMQFYNIDLLNTDLDINAVIDVTNKEKGIFTYTSVYAYIVGKVYPKIQDNQDLQAFFNNSFVAQSVLFSIMSTYDGFNGSEINDAINSLAFLTDKFVDFKTKIFSTNGFYIYDLLQATSKEFIVQATSGSDMIDGGIIRMSTFSRKFNTINFKAGRVSVYL